VTARQVNAVSGALVETDAEMLSARLRTMPYPKLLRWADTREKLELAAAVRGYRRGWVYYQLRALGCAA
jgi:hypothetical protein